MNGSISRDYVLAIVGEARWVALGRIDIFQRDGEMHDVQVKVLDAPVLKLLFANRLNAVMIMEGVPKFGDKEQLFTLDKSIFDGASDTLTAFLLIAVI